MNTTQSTAGEMERAAQAMKENRWNDAVADLKSAHERSPDSIDILGQFGFALSRNEQYREATRVFEELSAKQPTDPKWPYMIGYQYYQQKDWARAIEQFDKALTLRPSYVKVLYRKGYAHAVLGQEQKAIDALTNCIAHWGRMTPTAQERDRSSYGKAQFQIGKIYLKKGRPFKARGHLQIAARFDSNDHDVLYELGQCYLKLNLIDEAVRTLQTADRIKPGTDYILDRLAQSHEQKGDYAAAEHTYQRIPQHRRRPFVLQHLGTMYLRQGQHQKALQCLEAAARKALKRITEMIATLPSPKITTTSEDNEGIIESYNESRGFGFINTKSQQHVFFHVSVFAGQRKPCQGSRVTFASEPSAKGPRAVRVELIEK